MKRTEKKEPTIAYSSMIPGEEPPYRPLLTEQIDIEQGLQELGQVSVGLVEVEDALEEWGEYRREPKLKGALSYLDQCIVDWDEERTRLLTRGKKKISQGDTVCIQLIGLGRRESAFFCLVRLLREGTKGIERRCFMSPVLRDLIRRESAFFCLVRLLREGTKGIERRCFMSTVLRDLITREAAFFCLVRLPREGTTGIECGSPVAYSPLV